MIPRYPKGILLCIYGQIWLQSPAAVSLVSVDHKHSRVDNTSRIFLCRTLAGHDQSRKTIGGMAGIEMVEDAEAT